MLRYTILLGWLLLLVADQTASHLGSGPFITDVNILLPPRMTHPVKYRLRGSDGCFKWSWDYHDILSVLPEYNSTSHCSTSALLRSITPFSGRKETVVYAADANTGVVIRRKVFIDKLSRIQIFPLLGDSDNLHVDAIRLQAMRRGRALVRMSIHRMPQKSNYNLISVGAHISPQNPVLRIGSHLNFSIEGLNDKISGRWRTANGSVISVSPLSGVAEVVGEGTTQVYFEALSLKLRTTVTVPTEDIVSVDAPTETLTNVPFPTKGYNFSVTIRYAKPWLDFDTGRSYCCFFPYSPEHLVRLVPKSKDMKSYISVSINASLREADHVYGSASALFVGGFSILDMGKDSMQLKLTPDSNKTTITILGNTDVEIYWHERDSLLVTPIHKEGSGIGGRAKYEVKMLGSKRFNDTIFITLPANGQSVEIDVNSDPGERTASETIFARVLGCLAGDLVERTASETIWATVLGCLALSASTVAVTIRYKLDRSQTSIKPPPATPSIAGPVAPESTSNPANVSEQSTVKLGTMEVSVQLYALIMMCGLVLMMVLQIK